MTHEDEIKSLVAEMAILVDTMCRYAVRRTISHEQLCRCLAEDAAEWNRLLCILQDDLKICWIKPKQNPTKQGE
ncbi:MAG: hypothetical protein II943_00540 [Victivallales bacterium]|nr:hypothetical protein [Victivallales bacterium]